MKGKFRDDCDLHRMSPEAAAENFASEASQSKTGNGCSGVGVKADLASQEMTKTRQSRSPWTSIRPGK